MLRNRRCTPRCVTLLSNFVFASNTRSWVSVFVYMFRGTYPGAAGKSIGSQTDRNLRAAIGEGCMNNIYTDMFAVVTASIELFKKSGGSRLFKEVKKCIEQSDEWMQCIRVSN